MTKHLKRLITVVLALAVIISAALLAIPTAAAAPTSAGYQLYLSDFLLENPSSQRIVTGKYISPYRKLVEDRKDDPVWNSLLKSWAILTFDLSDLSSYCDKSIGYYEAILFDVLCDSQQSENSMADLNAICKSTQAGTAKKVFDLFGDVLKISLKDLQKDTAQYNEIMNSIENMEELSDAFGVIGKISTVVQYCTDVNDLLLKCSRLQSALNVYSQAGQILNDIYYETSDPSLKYACQKFKTILDNSVDKAEFLTIFIEEDTVFELADSILGDVWDMLVSELTGYGLAIKAGQTLGKLASNALFSTDETIECYYSMLALYEFENCLRSCVQDYESSYKSSPNFSRSEKYNEGFLMLAKTELEGSEYVLKFLEIMNEKGLVNECYHTVKESNMTWLMGVSGAFLDFTQRNYDTEKRMIASTTAEIKGILEYLNTDAYNDYVEIIQDYVAVSSAPIVIEKEPQLVSDEALENYIKSLDEVSQQFSNCSFDKATTLTEDITVYGDVYMSADVDLNGHALNIAGDLYQTGGILTINNGTLNVAGDYRIQKETVNNIGEVEYSSVYARFVMNKANDKVNVAGSFITRSDYSHTLSAGTLTIGGDVYDWLDDIYAGNAHKTVLNGTGKQNVYFNSSSSRFYTLEATNTNIECTGYFSAFSLGSDITITSKNAKIYSIDLNVKKFTVNGDVEMIGDINVNGGTMTVNGKLQQTGGILTINNGTLNVSGDYRIQKETVNNIGEVDYSAVYARFVMNKANDKVNVAGSFITRSNYSHTLSAGTLTVGGDVYDWLDDIYAGNAHKTVLNGTDKQNVYFNSSSSRFYTLEATNTNIECTGYFAAFSLGSDITITSKNAKIYSIDLNVKKFTVNGDVEMVGDINVNGGTMTVNGKLQQTYGTLTINNGTLNVSGDYRIQKETVNNIGEVEYSAADARLIMNKANDKVNVAGSFVTRSNYYSNSSSHTLSAGTMTIGGDVYGWLHDIYASGTHKTILNGTGKQTVYFDDSYSHFNILEATNTNIECTGYFAAFSLGSDITITSKNVKIWGIDVNVKKFTVNGDVEIVDDINVNGGTMTVNGKLQQTYGTLTLNNGTLNVTGDYRIQKETVNNIGEVEYSAAYARLIMNKANDKVNVAGSFITRSNYYSNSSSHTLSAGTMTIGGDVYGWIYDINANCTHKTILNGTNKQTVYFDNSSSRFNILELTQPRSNYTFTPDNCWNELIESYNEKPEPPVVTAIPGDKQVTLTWEAVTGAEMYRAYLYVNGAYTRVYSGDSSATRAVITGLTNGTKYGFAVSVKANGFWSDYSELVYATPTAVVKPKITGYKIGDGKVKLEWNAVPYAEMYRVYTYRKGVYTRAFTCDGTRNVATVTGLNGGLKYGFVVSAKVNGVWTDYSNASDLVYAVPTGTAKPSIVAFKEGDYKVKLEWKAVEGAEMYRVYTCENGVYTRKFTCLGSRNIATVTGLVSGTKYGFVVSAKVNGVWTDYSNADDLVYATPTGEPKPVITGYKTGDGKVKLTWYALEGAEMYRVYSILNGTYKREFTTYDSTTATVTGLVNGTEYGFVVSAKVNGVWTTYNVPELILYATPNP